MKIIAVHTLKSKTGITLIELLIVVVIVGILAAIGIPMYNGYMERARRVDAKTALEQIRASQEMMRAERGRYSTDLTLVQLQTTWGGPVSPAGDYNITMVATTTTHTGTATPFTSRQSSDGWLRINQDGVKTSQFPDRWTK
ncbi:MAG: type IV pilin protein [Deltaproteobacteria bacterium]